MVVIGANREHCDRDDAPDKTKLSKRYVRPSSFTREVVYLSTSVQNQGTKRGDSRHTMMAGKVSKYAEMVQEAGSSVQL